MNYSHDHPGWARLKAAIDGHDDPVIAPIPVLVAQERARAQALPRKPKKTSAGTVSISIWLLAALMLGSLVAGNLWASAQQERRIELGREARP